MSLKPVKPGQNFPGIMRPNHPLTGIVGSKHGEQTVWSVSPSLKLPDSNSAQFLEALIDRNVARNRELMDLARQRLEGGGEQSDETWQQWHETLKIHVLSDVAALARFSESTTANFLRHHRIDRWSFPEKAVEFARDTRILLKILEKALPDRIRAMGHEEFIEQLAVIFELTLHISNDLGAYLTVLKVMMKARNISWSELLLIHREQSSNHEDEVLRKIDGQGGVIPFDRYFSLAMYEANYAVYSGKAADRLIGTGEKVNFWTSSEEKGFGIHLLFYLQRQWQLQGNPKRFDVVEMGAGNGSLAESILENLHAMSAYSPAWKEFKEAVHYSIQEISPTLARLQRERLARFGVQVHEGSALTSPLPRVACGVFLSNELLDMFPPKKIKKTGGEILEVYITTRGGVLQEVLGPLSPEARTFIRNHRIRLDSSEEYYIQPSLGTLVRNVDRHLERGVLLNIDYGEPRKELRSRGGFKFDSVFRGYAPSVLLGMDFGWIKALQKEFKFLTDPDLKGYFNSTTGIRWPKDMTVDVDFTTLEEEARRSGGFEAQQLKRQTQFLTSIFPDLHQDPRRFRTDLPISTRALRQTVKFTSGDHNMHVSILEKSRTSLRPTKPRARKNTHACKAVARKQTSKRIGRRMAKALKSSAARMLRK